jgi:hypothetical protein
MFGEWVMSAILVEYRLTSRRGAMANIPQPPLRAHKPT